MITNCRMDQKDLKKILKKFYLPFLPQNTLKANVTGVPSMYTAFWKNISAKS